MYFFCSICKFIKISINFYLILCLFYIKGEEYTKFLLDLDKSDKFPCICECGAYLTEQKSLNKTKRHTVICKLTKVSFNIKIKYIV